MTSLESATFTPTASAGFPELLDIVNEATVHLAASRVVSPPVQHAVRELTAKISARSVGDFGDIDPYQVQRLLLGVLAAHQALDIGDNDKQRRQLRIGLEQVRQGLRDVVDEHHVAADRPAREIARWLVAQTKLPQAEVAKLAGVSSRTFQRWTSTAESTQPSGDDEIRLRTLARAVDQLRWSMTPAGVVRWLQRPNPGLKNRPPAEILGEPGAYETLRRLAGGARSMVAT